MLSCEAGGRHPTPCWGIFMLTRMAKGTSLMPKDIRTIPGESSAIGDGRRPGAMKGRFDSSLPTGSTPAGADAIGAPPFANVNTPDFLGSPQNTESRAAANRCTGHSLPSVIGIVSPSLVLWCTGPIQNVAEFDGRSFKMRRTSVAPLWEQRRVGFLRSPFFFQMISEGLGSRTRSSVVRAHGTL